MARATFTTKLSLDRWAQLIGVHPLHFNGVTVADIAPATGCSVPWLQHSWQDFNRVSREDVAEAIQQAEESIERYLGYRLMPAWETDEWRPTTRPFRPEFINLSSTDIRGFPQAVRADWGYLISGGIVGKTLIEAASAIVWSDADGDGYDETGTLSAATTVTDPCEIALYYPGESGADEWEIRPITVSIAAGVVTITFRRELAVLPGLMEALNAGGVDGLDDPSFLDEADIYRKFNDPQTQVSFLWEPFASGCACENGGCNDCAYQTQTGCLLIRGDPRQGLLSFKPADWDADAEEFDPTSWSISRQPDITRLYYYAGFRDKRKGCPENQMSPLWEQAVVAYSASLLQRSLCECDIPHSRAELWQADLAFSSGAGELSSYGISPGDLDNPFGTRRGAVYAWKRVMREARGEAVLA